MKPVIVKDTKGNTRYSFDTYKECGVFFGVPAPKISRLSFRGGSLEKDGELFYFVNNYGYDNNQDPIVNKITKYNKV